MSAQQTILIVDDTPQNIQMIAAVLKGTYKIKVATTGERALALAGGDEKPDLILLDVVMPGMDGYEVCRRLKANTNLVDIPVIFLTARTEVHDEAKGFELGAVDYIHKPFSPPIVQARVHSWLEKKRLHDVERAYLYRMEMQADVVARELDAARRMQQSILPSSYPYCPDNSRNMRCSGVECVRYQSCPSIRLCASMIPAKEVGGDFFDYFWLDDRRLGFVVADVSGKGVPAALFMSLSLALLRTIESISAGPSDCLARLNRQLCRDNEMQMFVTLFYGIYDASSGFLRYASAGHGAPYLMDPSGEVSHLPRVAGTALGIIEAAEFEENSIALVSGATICVYTDGVTEAVSPTNEEFGEGRLMAVLKASYQVSIESIMAQILASVQRFADGTPQSDDITCLILRRAKAKRYDTMKLMLVNQLPQILRLADSVEAFLEQHHLASKLSHPMNLALDEVLTNIISYAFPKGGHHEIEVNLSLDDDQLVARILDAGVAFNPLDRPPPDLLSSLDERSLGGLGLHFVKTLMDEVEYWRQGEKNCLLLVKRIDALPKEN